MHSTLIESLQSPDAYPYPVDSVQRIETHISWVLLAGEYVYKIKKPLDLGFLDFSTLEARKHYCEEELRLNRRTAPELYLDVIAIGSTPEQPILGGDGPAIEYAVKMRRFDPDQGFDHLLKRGELGRSDIIDLGRRLAKLHEDAAVAPGTGPQGTFKDVADPMRDNFDELKRQLAGAADADRLAPLRSWTNEQLEQLRPRIEQRLKDGRVRECHGDAHLGNIVRIDGRATLFDCIEFSEDLRWTDVIADLAFTVMDLRDHGADALAWRLIDEYLAASGDYQGAALLPLYIVYRAMVRAKVNGFQLNDPDADHDQVLNEIRNYLALAEQIAAESRAAVTITMGVSGSGKSWLAERLIEPLRIVRLRSDVERKRIHGLPPDARTGSELDQNLYSPEATERTYDHLVESAEALLHAGIPALVDATCLKRWQRQCFRNLAQKHGVPFAVLHTSAESDILRERLAKRNQAGDDPSEADSRVLDQQLTALDSMDAEELKTALKVDTRIDGIVESIISWIRRSTFKSKLKSSRS